MDRRHFLRFLGMGAAAAVAPKVSYSFLGGILRPRASLLTIYSWRVVTLADVMYEFEPVQRAVHQAYVDSLSLRNPICDDIPWMDTPIT
jgi:hypothetical protein